MPTGDDLIHQLRIYRLERRLSQQALAKQLGVAYSTVNRWLNLRIRPSQIQEYHLRKFLKADSSKLNG
jgi:transcriptional regulator with XRE-family HTH domain